MNNLQYSNSSPSNFPEWTRAAASCVWSPYTQMKTAPLPIPVERAQGVYLYTADGGRLLDGISSWWVNIHGHNHPRLNRALQNQLERLAQVIFAGFVHEPAVRLAEALREKAPPGLTRVFYSDDGSTAVEVALKMAYQHWRNLGQTQRTLFLGLEHGYHGDTVGSMAVGNVREFHSCFSDLFFQVQHLPIDGHRLEEVLEREHQRVVALIVEPLVQGAGGMIIYPVEFLRKLREVTRHYGIPLIADEVFTGFGRTGTLFACQHGPVTPDLMCLSKGLTGGYLPLGVTLASEEIYQSFLSPDRSRAFLHGHSFTGNALSCAVALESLALFEDEKRLERVAQLETLFGKRLQQLQGLAPVRETRGIGGLAVVELEPQKRRGYLDDTGPLLSRAFLERGVFLRPLGNVLYFLPPYVISDEEVNWVFDTIEEVLQSELAGDR